jgi:dolichyl-phosphate-mannose-protein mannosyltransferase
MLKKYDNAGNSFTPVCILVAVTLACFIPFVSKAVHIDDYLFLSAARQIQAHPFDFYGFNVNWYYGEEPMSLVTKNPPLLSYYLAFVASWAGWSEITLHVAMLFPTLAAVLGSYLLAKKLGANPLTATFAGIFTPVFLISGTSLMCDTMMVSWWVWAVYFWLRGMENDNVIDLLSAAFMIAACSLTKYYGASLIPLLLVYSLVKKRRLGNWLLFMIIPVIILACYQWLTYKMYGVGLLLDAGTYAAKARNITGQGVAGDLLTGLSFTGGCLITALFLAPLLWGKKWLAGGAAVLVLIVCGLAGMDKFGVLPLQTRSGVNWLAVLQLSLFIVSGLSLISLTVADLWKNRDADSCLLFCWILGTFVFACLMNWTVSGRNILPMVPAAGIILARRLGAEGMDRPGRSSWLAAALGLSLLIGLMAAWADYRLADTARDAAARIGRAYAQIPGKLWFQGHWGFQYYMERVGGKPVDFNRSILSRGDIVVTPRQNTNVRPLPEDLVVHLNTVSLSPGGPLSVFFSRGAGFYTSVCGPLPFALGKAQNMEYLVDIYASQSQLPLGSYGSIK